MSKKTSRLYRPHNPFSNPWTVEIFHTIEINQLETFFYIKRAISQHIFCIFIYYKAFTFRRSQEIVKTLIKRAGQPIKSN